jgi:hypothetical protein
MPSEKDVTLVVTSCGRHDLLARTLESLYRHCAGKAFDEVIIAEDWDRLGQVRNIDRAYERVKTTYVAHWEDDWETTAGGWLRQSIDILHTYPKILQVWLRAHDDTNGHPIVKLRPFNVPTMSTDFAWKGFSWNPGLRRLSDWKRIGGYSKHIVGNNSLRTERAIGELYCSLGYHAAILPEPGGYVRHIGDGRSLGGHL